MAADALRHRDVSSKVREKLVAFFKEGFTPAKALDLHKYDLQVEHGDNYVVVSGDRSVCPDLGYCYRYGINVTDFTHTKKFPSTAPSHF